MSNDNVKLRSEQVQEILTKVPNWMVRWGNLLILLIILLSFLLTWLIEYPEIISAEIVITTQNPPERVFSKVAGRVEAILVKDRAIVTKNTPLAIIENSGDYQDIFLLKRVLDLLEINKTEFDFKKLPNLKLGEIENAYAIFENDYSNYILNRKLQPYNVEKSSQQVELIQLKERQQLLAQQREISRASLQLKKNELERHKTLFRKGVVAIQELENKNIEYLQAESNFKNVNSQLSQIKSTLNELNSNRQTTIINQTKDEILFFRNALQSLSQLKKTIAEWELKYVLNSSVVGEVSFMQIWSKGQMINPGDIVFTVVPKSLTNYIGKVKAKGQNSGKLKNGQKVNIRLINYPYREYGILLGKVSSISLTPDKDGYLLLNISLPNGLITSYEKQINFHQEMTGTADIVTEDMRLIERLLYQFRELFKTS